MGTQRLDYRAPHETRHDGKLWQHQRDHRSHLVDEGAITPATDWHPLQREGKEQLEQRCHYKCGNGAAGRGRGNDSIIGRAVLIERGKHPEDAAKQQGQHEGAGPELI